jgi:glycosyltransferase involved in cell wall biosynthesis
MHILLVFTYEYSLKFWKDTGVLDREIHYFNHIKDRYRDVKFTILTFGDDSDLNFQKLFPNAKIIPVYSQIKMSKFKLVRYIKSFYLPFKLKNYLSDIDVIKQFQLQGAWISIIFKYLLKKPLYVRTGYDMYKFSIQENKSNFKRFLYRSLTWFSLKNSDLYTVSTNSDQKFLKNQFKLSHNIEVIPNWVLFKKPLKKFSERHSKKILSIGRLENQKNFSALINIFSNTDVEIDIVGTGSMFNELVKQKEELNTKVNFLGKLNFDELQQLYSNYNIFVSTSTFEGNPKTILEAQANDCLVIALEENNIKEIVIDEQTGFICNINNFQEKVLNSLNESSINKDIIKNAKQRVEKYNNLENIISMEIKLLSELN